MFMNSVTLNGFRPLTSSEITTVSGGSDEIVVTGRKLDVWVTSISREDFWMYPELFDSAGGLGSGGGAGFSGGGGGGGGELSDPEGDGAIDSDGDGVDDTIIVTAPERVEFADGYYGYIYSDTHVDIMQEANWFLSLFGADDKFIGHYAPDADGSFVIKDPATNTSTTVTVPINGTPVVVGGSYEETPQTEWRFSPTSPDFHEQ
ncbi:hypothetical protein [Qipengyuania sp. YIM B01966]|uniref:hypothetical protein n=1 Tax=Qipengyuania sp. YIM B01966 TaxID=2778646 RepID=UPI0018F3B7D3|nr:hypothetical protein [Qipengyuania sp. YIM B01966]